MTQNNFFHEFDPSTETKLDLLSLYVREWLPVFLSRPEPTHKELHIFDFFSGPGRDAQGNPGSPLRIAEQFFAYQGLAGWEKVRKVLHLHDANPRFVDQLNECLPSKIPGGVEVDIRCMTFSEALSTHRSILESRTLAKLLWIDQFGVKEVPNDVFLSLTTFPSADLLFFISSATLFRFSDHPAIRQKISKPDDFFHVHRSVRDYYRELIPDDRNYYLAPFSIKRDSNIYGLIFGAAHPLAIDKFLRVCWKKDELSGEANYDIDRDNLEPNQMVMDLSLFKPKKLQAFENDLRRAIISGTVRDERDVFQICVNMGVTPSHAKVVIEALKNEGKIQTEFTVPNVRRFKDPKALTLLKCQQAPAHFA